MTFFLDNCSDKKLEHKRYMHIYVYLLDSDFNWIIPCEMCLKTASAETMDFIAIKQI